MNPYIKLPPARLLFGRQAPILELARGKKVLHVGCVDAMMLHERYEHGKHMHRMLASTAAELWGVDIDAEGVAFLQNQGIANLIVADVAEIDQVEELKGHKFDVIVASEIVEHLPNPSQFLRAIKALMVPDHTQLVVSVPNAFRVRTLLMMLRGIEFVHPDHNYWFSYLTATNLMRKNGHTIKRVDAYYTKSYHLLPRRLTSQFKSSNGNKSQLAAETRLVNARARRFELPSRVTAYLKSLPERLLTAFLYRRSPFWGDGLIVVSTISDQA